MGTVTHFSMEMGALEGVVEADVGAVRIYAVHLGAVSSRERIVQVGGLLDIHARAPAGGGAWCGSPEIHGDETWTSGEPRPPMPRDAILMGDFNFEPGGREYEAIVGPSDPINGRVSYPDGFVDAWVAAGNHEISGVTYPGDETFHDMRIDYCFVSATLAHRVRSAWVDTEAEGSDHNPVWVEIDL